MTTNRIGPTLNRIGRQCFLLLVFLSAILWTGAACGEERPVVRNASGNLNLRPSVDPFGDGGGWSAVLYDNRNGLPTSEANAIAQTGDGFLWIGSYAGLIRYDGHTFERIGIDDGILNTRCLYVDSRGRLWIGTNDFGIFLMRDGVPVRVDREGRLASISIRAIAEDRDGVMYFATAAGIAMVDAELNLTVPEDPRISGKTVTDLRPGADGLIYGLTLDGDLFTVRGGGLLTFVDHTQSRYGSLIALLPDPERPGAVYFTVTGDALLRHGTPEAGDLTADTEWTMGPLTGAERMESIDGRIWICAANGIGRVDGDGFRLLENAPMDKLVGHVMTDHEGNLWFTSTRQCVMKIVPNRFRDLFAACGLPEEIVNSTCMYGNQLFVGTDSGLIVLEDGKKADRIPLTRAVTASGEPLETDDLAAYLEGSRIRSIIRDSRGRLWICVWNERGLLRYDRGKSRRSRMRTE